MKMLLKIMLGLSLFIGANASTIEEVKADYYFATFCNDKNNFGFINVCFQDTKNNITRKHISDLVRVEMIPVTLTYYNTKRWGWRHDFIFKNETISTRYVNIELENYETNPYTSLLKYNEFVEKIKNSK